MIGHVDPLAPCARCHHMLGEHYDDGDPGHRRPGDMRRCHHAIGPAWADRPTAGLLTMCDCPDPVEPGALEAVDR